MKKLLFILFFPITIPLYLIYRFFGWLSDTFIPFVQYDVIPFLSDTLFPAIKKFINYIKEKSAERKAEKNSDISPDFSAEIQRISNPIEINSDVNSEYSSEETVSNSPSVEQEIKQTSDNLAVYSADVPIISHTVEAIQQENICIRSLSPKIDYEKYSLVEDGQTDPLYIRAMAVAVYEKSINIYTLQRFLKISYGRAYFLLKQLLEGHIIYANDDNSYSPAFTEEYFEKLLSDVLESESTSSTAIQFSKKEIDDLCYKYSHQFSDIDYKKYSKIVNIFTNKWRNICKREFIVLDFETTGLDYMEDRIIEIAAIKYENGIETDKFIHLVNPLMPIPYAATRINHITDEMVADADTERYLIPQLIEFLSDSLLVGHNLNFDLHFLEAAAQRYGFTVEYNYIDTLSVSKKLFPDLLNYKLTTIAKNLGHNIIGMHRAEEDVRVCAEIIQIALDSLE